MELPTNVAFPRNLRGIKVHLWEGWGDRRVSLAELVQRWVAVVKPLLLGSVPLVEAAFKCDNTPATVSLLHEGVDDTHQVCYGIYGSGFPAEVLDLFVDVVEGVEIIKRSWDVERGVVHPKVAAARVGAPRGYLKADFDDPTEEAWYI